MAARHYLATATGRAAVPTPASTQSRVDPATIMSDSLAGLVLAVVIVGIVLVALAGASWS
jgi:hypothetical protein